MCILLQVAADAEAKASETAAASLLQQVDSCVADKDELQQQLDW